MKMLYNPFDSFRHCYQNFPIQNYLLLNCVFNSLSFHYLNAPQQDLIF